MRHHLATSLALFALLLPAMGASEALAAASAGPATTTLKRGQKKIDHALRQLSLIRKNAAASNKTEAAATQRLRQAVNSFIDFGELARRALGKHWKEQSKADQLRFQAAVKSLVETAYLSRVQDSADVKLSFQGEQALAAGEVEVQTLIHGAKGEFPIAYRLYQRVASKPGSPGKGRWRVYDVVTDGLSLMESYRSQFNKLIKKKGFEGLMKTLERKQAELDKQSKQS